VSLAYNSSLSAFAAALVLVAVPVARAQVSGVPVHAGSGPLSDLSDSVSAGSRPVRDPGSSSLREMSRHSLSDGPVSDTRTGSVHSGSVSDATVGSVHSAKGRVCWVPLPAYDDDEEFLAETAHDLTGLEGSIAGVEPLPAEPETAPTDLTGFDAAESAVNPPPAGSPQ
jgi:hypothetical protein